MKHADVIAATLRRPVSWAFAQLTLGFACTVAAALVLKVLL